MSKRKDIDLIRDIIESIERIVTYTQNIEYRNFTKDYKTQDAVIRNVEIMGRRQRHCLKRRRKIIRIFLGKTLLEQETN